MVMDEKYERIKIFAFSAKVVDGWLAGYSLMTFYTGVVITIGFALKTLFFSYTYTATITEIN
jgi:hypothetical protein